MHLKVFLVITAQILATMASAAHHLTFTNIKKYRTTLAQSPFITDRATTIVWTQTLLSDFPTATVTVGTGSSVTTSVTGTGTVTGTTTGTGTATGTVTGTGVQATSSAKN